MWLALMVCVCLCRLYDNKGDVTDDPHQVKWLESRVPHMGLLCRIQRSALKIFYYVAGLVTGEYHQKDLSCLSLVRLSGEGVLHIKEQRISEWELLSETEECEFWLRSQKGFE